jgi:polysaccharide biosynthesis/export protein
MRTHSKVFVRHAVLAMMCLGLIVAKTVSSDAQNDRDMQRSGLNKEYLISVDDILEITVYGEEDFSTTVRVAQDGTVNYPYLGNIRAVGLTLRELEANITELLAQDYLVNPQVRAFVKEYSKKISMLGAIRSPGSYQLKERLSFTQAVALAGGFTDSANTAAVKIIRDNRGRKDTFYVDYERILDRTDYDIEIKGDDIIVVEEYGRFSVMGQVAKPGVYTMRKGLRASEAVGLAGGFTSTAAQNGTRVVRMEKGVKKVIPVPVADIMRSGDVSRDVLLQEGDTVMVPESFF